MANEALFNDNPDLENKETKVKFKEDLVDYEPSLTEDDVNSIESDNTNTDNIEYDEISNEQMVNNQIETHIVELNLNLYNADQEVEEDIEEEEEEEDTMYSVRSVSELVTSEVTATLENFTLSSLNTNEADTKVTDKIPTRTVTKPKRTRLKKNTININEQVECKNHCIERLDFGLNLSVNKLKIHEKPVDCPTLKLQRRKCCEENKILNPQYLPCYSGSKSEYGLTSLQLERKEKRREIILQKAERRRQLMDEYKERRKQQNEVVFSQWLREVSKRKKQKVNATRSEVRKKEALSPSVLNFPTRVMGTDYCKERPRTAGDFIPSHGIKHTKRPHTSPAKVYIEVSRNLLNRGINVGNLLITTSKSIESKNLHILTVS